MTGALPDLGAVRPAEVRACGWCPSRTSAAPGSQPGRRSAPSYTC
jgi:hypothetical protein